MKRTNESTWKIDPSLLDKSSRHYFWELEHKDLLIVVHHIFDMRMDDLRGQLAIFKNCSQPTKILSLPCLIDASGDIIQFSEGGDFLFVKPHYYRPERIFATPYLVLDLNEFRFAFFPMQDAWRYRVEDLGSGTFRLKLDNTPQFEFPQRDGNVFRVEELEWHSFDESELIAHYLDRYPAKRIIYSSEKNAAQGVEIARSFETIDAFLSDPKNYASWARYLGTEISQVKGNDWRVQMQAAELQLRFARGFKPGSHIQTVTYPDGQNVEFHLLAYPKESGCYVNLSFARRSGVTNEEFGAEMDGAKAALQTLKRLLET